MNYFAIVVTVLQVFASFYYLYLDKKTDAGIWILYAIINIIIMNRDWIDGNK